METDLDKSRWGGDFDETLAIRWGKRDTTISNCLNSQFLAWGGAQWAKIMVHSTLIKQFYENGQIYEQNID